MRSSVQKAGASQDTKVIDTSQPSETTKQDEKKDEGLEEKVAVKRLSEVDFRVYVGMTDSEITEHSIRKIIECIV